MVTWERPRGSRSGLVDWGRLEVVLMSVAEPGRRSREGGLGDECVLKGPNETRDVKYLSSRFIE